MGRRPAEVLPESPLQAPALRVLSMDHVGLPPSHTAGLRPSLADCVHQEAGGERGWSREEGPPSRLPPSCLPAGCVGIPLSMKKQNQSFLRRSKRATMNLSLHSGMIFLSQVSVKDKAEVSREMS